VSYRGLLTADERLTVSSAGSARITNAKTGEALDVKVEVTGQPAALEPDRGKVFHFWQDNRDVWCKLTLNYGREPAAATHPPDIFAQRLLWLREPYMVFQPVSKYNGGLFLTGFFVEAHIAHQHLGKVPELRAVNAEAAPSGLQDPVWKTTQAVELVRGRSTPPDQIGRWDYMSKHDTLPFHNLGFPADISTRVHAVCDPDGVTFLVQAEGAPIAGESLVLTLNGKPFEIPIHPEATFAGLQELSLGESGWSALLYARWTDMGLSPETDAATAPKISLNLQRERGTDSYIFSPPLGSNWGQDQQGPGELVLAPDT